MNEEKLGSPVSFMGEYVGHLADESVLRAYEAWWVNEGWRLSEGVDRAGTLWLKMEERLHSRDGDRRASGRYDQCHIGGHRVISAGERAARWTESRRAVACFSRSKCWAGDFPKQKVACRIDWGGRG